MESSKQIINNILKGKDLTFEESKFIFLDIMSGNVNESLIHNFLVGLADKGETAEEIAGGVYVLREKALKVDISKDIIDTCGTGGDGKNTLNISTASALLLASMGIKVAKHGNKAVSSKCGSGDVLEELNININLEPRDIEKQIIERWGTLFEMKNLTFHSMGKKEVAAFSINPKPENTQLPDMKIHTRSHMRKLFFTFHKRNIMHNLWLLKMRILNREPFPDQKMDQSDE